MILLKPRRRPISCRLSFAKLVTSLRNAASAKTLSIRSGDTVCKTTQGLWVSSHSFGSSFRHTRSVA